MALGPNNRSDMHDIANLLEGTVEERLRGAMSALSQAENQLHSGELLDLGPLGRAIAVLAVDIQAMPAHEGRRLAPMLEVLSDGLKSLAEGLTVRVEANRYPIPPGHS